MLITLKNILDYSIVKYNDKIGTVIKTEQVWIDVKDITNVLWLP